MGGREHLETHETEVAENVSASVSRGGLLEEDVGSFAVEVFLGVFEERDETAGEGEKWEEKIEEGKGGRKGGRERGREGR